MSKAKKLGSRSTADEVLAGIDLNGKHVLVMGGSDPGIGFETVSALAANGAHVIVAGRTVEEAERSCSAVGYRCSPLSCDLGDLASVRAAVKTIRSMQITLDSIVVIPTTLDPPAERERYGVDEYFLVNHIGHFALLNELAAMLRDTSGRIVIVTQATPAPRHIEQSELANALFAKELSRRLQPRGILVNAVDPGRVRNARPGAGAARRLLQLAAFPFMRSAAQGAATVALLAASPAVGGISGEIWKNCRVARGIDVFHDSDSAQRRWKDSSEIVARAARLQGLPRAA